MNWFTSLNKKDRETIIRFFIETCWTIQNCPYVIMNGRTYHAPVKVYFLKTKYANGYDGTQIHLLLDWLYNIHCDSPMIYSGYGDDRIEIPLKSQIHHELSREEWEKTRVGKLVKKED